MSTELIPFEYDAAQVRVVSIDGEPWFVLADLAAVLEISDVSRLASRLEDGVRQTHPIPDRLGRTQQATIVSESGMYEVVIRSDKPEAAAFRRWITGTVLPEIRRTGGYKGVPALEGPELLAHAILAANKMITEKDERIAELTEKAAEDAPKVNYVELYVAGADLLSIRTLAANNDVQEKWLRELLVDKEWIYVDTDTRWSNSKGCKEIVRRYSAYAHKRSYFRPVENHEAPRFKGEVMHTLKVTPAGAEAIARLIARVTKGAA